MPSEAGSGASNSNYHCTTLDHTDMVHQPSESPGGCAQNLSSNQEGAVSSSARRCPPSVPETASSGMQGVRCQLIECNIPVEIADVLMSSWRPATRKQYDAHIRRWCAFALQKKIDPLHPSVSDVLQFLHTFRVNQLSYSTINTARSALSSYLMGYQFPGCHYTVANHPFIVRYLKGVFNCCKPAPRYQETWDVKPVLEYLELLHPLDKLSLKELTHKLAILLALTSGQRCQTLSFLRVDAMKKTPDYYLLIFMLSRTDLGMFFRRFLLGSTLKSRFAFIVLLNTILREPSLSVTMTMATFSFHMSNLIGTLVRVQLDDGLKLFWEQVEWTQQSLRLTAPDQQLHRKQVI